MLCRHISISGYFWFLWHLIWTPVRILVLVGAGEVLLWVAGICNQNGEVGFIKIISSHTMVTFDHVFHLEQIVEKLLKRKTSWVECLKFRTISALFWLELLQNVSFGHKLEKKRNNLPFNSHLRDQNEKLKWKFEHLMFKSIRHVKSF